MEAGVREFVPGDCLHQQAQTQFTILILRLLEISELTVSVCCLMGQFWPAVPVTRRKKDIHSFIYV